MIKAERASVIYSKHILWLVAFVEISCRDKVLICLSFSISREFNCNLFFGLALHFIAYFFQNLGCDRVINYKEEDFGKALRDEYPVIAMPSF